MGYQGRASFDKTTQTLKLDTLASSFNSSQTVFSLTSGSRTVFPATARNLTISINGVIQEPDTAYTVSGSTITFTSAPTTGATFFGVLNGQPNDLVLTPAVQSLTVANNAMAVNASGFFAGANVIANTTTVFVGNSSVNTAITAGAITLSGVTVGTNASTLSAGTLPLARLTSANTTANGVVDTTTQTLAGNKTFQNAASFSNTVSITGAANALSTLGVSGTLSALGQLSVTGNATFDTSTLFVDATNDRVGIGTTSPGYKLEVNGAIASKGSSSGGLQVWDRSDPTVDAKQFVLYNDAGYVRIYTSAAGADKFVINTTTGNVGIGTTGPSYPLHVSKSGSTEIYSEGTTQAGFSAMDSGAGADVKEARLLSNDGYFHIQRINDARTVANSYLSVNLSGGNVGIGTTSPANKCHVKSSSELLRLETTAGTGLNWIAFADASADKGYVGFTASGSETFVMQNQENGPLAFITNGTEYMRIANTGNVGIGTTSPSALLDITNTSSAATNGIIINANHSGGTPLLQLFTTATSGGNGRNWSITTNWDVAGDFTVRSSNAEGGSPYSAGTTRLVINRSGNVGIGTTSPDAPLAFAASTGDKIQLYDNGGSSTYGFGVQSNNLQILTASSGTDITFGYGLSASQTTLVTIKGGGNVGIGTTSPSSKLTVGSDFASIPGITVDTGNNNDSAFVARKAAGKPAFGILPWDSQVFLSAGTYYDGGTWVQHNDTNDNLIFTLDPGGGARWYASNNGSGSWNIASDIQLWDAAAEWTSTIKSTRSGTSYFTGGNVGIGTTSPAAKLDAVGNIRASGFSSGYLALTGDLSGYSTNVYPTLKTDGACIHFDAGGTYTGYICYNGGFVDVSDARLKTNVSPITNATATLLQLQGVNYAWADSRDNFQNHTGFIAQAVQAIIPEAVSASCVTPLDEPDSSRILGIQDAALTPWLVEAFKELYAELQDTKTQQQQQIAALEARLAALEG